MSASVSLPPPISPFPVPYFLIISPNKQFFLSLLGHPFYVPPQLSYFPLFALFFLFCLHSPLLSLSYSLNFFKCRTWSYIFRLGVLDSQVSVIHFKYTKAGVGHFIVSFSRNKNQVKVDPLIGSLRYKGVLSLVKAFLVYLSLWRGPQACYRILAALAEFGHSEMVLNLFSLGFWPADSQCLDGGVVDHYTGNLWDCKASRICNIYVYFQTFLTWVLCDCLLHCMILLRSQWGDLCLHIGLFMSWPLSAMPMLGVSMILVFSPCVHGEYSL